LLDSSFKNVIKIIDIIENKLISSIVITKNAIGTSINDFLLVGNEEENEIISLNEKNETVLITKLLNNCCELHDKSLLYSTKNYKIIE